MIYPSERPSHTQTSRWRFVLALVLSGFLVAASGFGSVASASPPTLNNVTGSPADRGMTLRWSAPADTSVLAGYAFRVSTDDSTWYMPPYPQNEPLVDKSFVEYEVRFNGSDGNPAVNGVLY